MSVNIFVNKSLNKIVCRSSFPGYDRAAIKSKPVFVLLLAFCIVLAFSTTAYAHRMIIQPREEGVIKVIYDDGSASSRRTEVVAYDRDNQEIKRDGLDREGFFSYPSETYLIVADDGLGHRAEWVVGEETTELPRGITISVVVTGLVVIAVFFDYRVKNRTQTP